MRFIEKLLFAGNSHFLWSLRAHVSFYEYGLCAHLLRFLKKYFPTAYWITVLPCGWVLHCFPDLLWNVCVPLFFLLHIELNNHLKYG